MACAGLCLLAVAPSAAATERSLDHEIRRLMEEQLERHRAPGMSVAVAIEKRIAHEVVAGFADREAGVRLAPDTVFQAASVSKILTATLVLRQVEHERLDLDAPANEYLAPERWIRDQDGAPVAATLRQLLTHTSGLPVSHEGIRDLGDDPQNLDDYLVGRLRTIREPGQKIIYSNDGYALLGYLAAKVAGQTFEHHARTALLDPLGMTSSSFRSPTELRARLAVGQGRFFGVFDRTSPVEPADASAIAPAGGLITTARDLARFGLLFLHGGEIDGRRILSPETVSEMTRLHVRQHPALDEGYGLGFMVRERGGRTVVWHDGGLQGVSARLLLVPEAGIAVAALSNTVEIDPVSAVVAQVVDLFAGPEDVTHESPDPSDLRSADGAYRLVDMLPPEDWYLNLFFNLEIDLSGRSPVLRRFPILDPLRIEPRGPSRFLIHGWHLDGAIAQVDRDRLYAGILEARRMAPWETARALMAYAALLSLAVLGAVVLGVRSVVQRLGRRQAGGMGATVRSDGATTLQP
jgi:CubicO group peptidase (beta-lactamase class C family)